MAERRASLMEPRTENLMARVDSKFTLVTLAAMRAREINDYYNQLGEGLGKIVPPQVTSVSRKPLSISLEEIEAGKIRAIPKPPEEDAEAEAEVLVEPERQPGALNPRTRPLERHVVAQVEPEPGAGRALDRRPAHLASSGRPGPAPGRLLRAGLA